jgi:hypothetical protein
MNNRRVGSGYDKESLFKDIDLKEIFPGEEIESIINELSINENKNEDSSFGIIKKNQSINLLYDRTELILKFLKLSIDKLDSYNENILARGLEW